MPLGFSSARRGLQSRRHDRDLTSGPSFDEAVFAVQWAGKKTARTVVRRADAVARELAAGAAGRRGRSRWAPRRGQVAGAPPARCFAMCTNCANRFRSHRRKARRHEPTQPTKSEVSGAMCVRVSCADQIVFSSMQGIELRPVGLDGSRCRSGEAPGPYTSCNCWACCAGSLSLFAFSQPPRDIRSGLGISAGWGWLVKGCIGAVRAGYSTAFLA